MSSMWLFGYGSLIWRPDFDFLQKQVGTINGWSRRFWQGSHDHRGVPGAPGRVVTLVPDAGGICAGMAFEVAGHETDHILHKLDYREKNGYQRHQVDCDLANGERVSCLVYVAGEMNEAYLGDASIAEIAAQIQTASGPSGSNSEYLANLASALQQHGLHDEHVFELQKTVEQLMESR